MLFVSIDVGRPGAVNLSKCLASNSTSRNLCNGRIGCRRPAERMQKGTALHIVVGRIWVALMTLVAMSSFFIYELKIWGNYSPIHFLSAWTLLSLGDTTLYAKVTLDVTSLL